MEIRLAYEAEINVSYPERKSTLIHFSISL